MLEIRIGCAWSVGCLGDGYTQAKRHIGRRARRLAADYIRRPRSCFPETGARGSEKGSFKCEETAVFAMLHLRAARREAVGVSIARDQGGSRDDRCVLATGRTSPSRQFA